MIFLTSNQWEIRETANKGKGLFAKKIIPRGTIIGDYLGTIIRPWEAVVDEHNFYLLYYHDRAAISPDITKPGIHLLNHACFPNCVFYVYKGHTLTGALRDIQPGEELTIHYALPPKENYCNPCEHVCHCGNIQCTKTMHLSKEQYTQWRKLSDDQMKSTKRERIRYNKPLPPLSTYPKQIPEDYMRSVNQLFQTI